MLVEEDLDLDVARALEEPLEDEPIVPEGGGCLTAGAAQGISEVCRLANHPHSLAAPARRRLDQQREADLARLTTKPCVRLVGAVVARDDRDAELDGESSRGGRAVARLTDYLNSVQIRVVDDTAGPGGEPVAKITVIPETATLAVGDSVGFYASLESAEGWALTGREVTWSVSDPGVLHLFNTVGQSVVLRATSAGTKPSA